MFSIVSSSQVAPKPGRLSSSELAAIRLKTIQSSEPFRQYLYDELNLECDRFFQESIQDKQLVDGLVKETMGMAKRDWDSSLGQKFLLSYDECLIFRRVFPKIFEAVCQLLTQDGKAFVESMNEFVVEKYQNKVVLTHVTQGQLMDLLDEQSVQKYSQFAIKRDAW